MLNNKRFAVFVCSAAFALSAWGQQHTEAADSLKTQSRTAAASSRNLLLNAASASQPRQISLGLPITGNAYIYEDGLPVSYYNYQIYPYKSWHSGVSHESVRTMSPQEMVLKYGVIAYSVDSRSRLAGDKFEGRVNYTLNHFGRQTLDANIAAPIGTKGWGFTLGSYQNFDPGSNKLDMSALHERTQFYKGSLSKSWNEGRGKAGLIYQYSKFMNLIENFGPFVFVGDGSVKEYDGFKLGIDQYLPANNVITYKDLATGEMKSQQINKANTDRVHNVNFVLDYNWDNGTKLSVSSKFKTGHSYRSNSTLTAVVDALAGGPYTYENGQEYVGKVQNRRMMHFDAFEHSWMNDAELTGSSANGRHKWLTELTYSYNHGGTTTSMYMFAHEAKKNPKMLLMNGQQGYSYNSYAEFYNGHEHKLAGIASDEWNVTDRLRLMAGVRLEYLHVRGHAINDEPGNNRHPGFSMADEGVELTPIRHSYFNNSFIGNVRYTLLSGFGVSAEYSQATIHSQLFHYGSFPSATQKGITAKYFRGGVFLKNKWIDLTTQITNITMTNSQNRPTLNHVLTKDVDGMKAGQTESVTVPTYYDMAALGWVTDATLTPFNGFSMHVMLTLRNPQYKNFELHPTFSDGVTEHYDFTNKTVTALSKTEIELEPSYRFDKWRVWASARYFSKQFINKTNTLYFNGRWETFGGVDYTLNDHVSFAASVVNMLNQKGASGNISSADLVTDVTPFKNYVMSGTFIRPFTVEFTTRLKF